MAEGGFSIEAMKVVIDSETEKFSAGMAKAQGLVQQFASAAGTELPKVDKAMLATGNAVEALRTKMGVFLRLAEYALEIGEKAMKMAGTAAAAIGKDEEFKAVEESVTSLASAVGSGLAAAFTGTKAEIAELTMTLAGMKQPTEDVSEEAQAASISIGKTLSEAIDRVATATKNFKIATYDVKGLTDAVSGLTQAFKGIGGANEEWKLEDWKKELVLLEQQMESAKLKAQEFDDMAGKSGQNVNQFAVLNAQDKVKSFTDRLTEMIEKVGQAKDKIAELSKEPDKIFDTAEIEKQIGAVQREVVALNDVATTYGMTKIAAEEYLTTLRAIRAVEDKNGDIPDDKRRAFEIELEERTRLKQQAADRKVADDLAKSTTGFDEKLAREIKAINDRSVALEMGEEAGAAYLARQKLIDEATQKGIILTDDLTRKIDQKAGAEQRLKDRQADLKSDQEDERNTEAVIKRMEREVANIQAKAGALGLASGAAARLSAEQAALNELQSKGVPLTDQLRTQIAAYGAEIEQATTRLQQQTRMLETIRDTGKAVTGELESAFKRWTQGSVVDVKQMASAILSDLAMLTFRKGVTENLSSVFNSGMSSLFGIGGMRAGGGPVTAGVPYVVGEKQAELFVPDQNGYILPSVPQVSNNSSTSNNRTTMFAPQISIDARGATPDAVRILEARIPTIIANVVTDLQERGALR